MTQGSAVSALCTLTFLEQQLAACRALNSRQEFHSWLLTLARFLAQEGEFTLFNCSGQLHYSCCHFDQKMRYSIVSH